MYPDAPPPIVRRRTWGKWNRSTTVVHGTAVPPTELVRLTSAPGWMPGVWGTDEVTAFNHSGSRAGSNMTPAVSAGAPAIRISLEKSMRTIVSEQWSPGSLDPGSEDPGLHDGIYLA